jgi:hypothetical protein
MANKKKKKKITWVPEDKNSDYINWHLIPKEKGETLLIHSKFKK